MRLSPYLRNEVDTFGLLRLAVLNDIEVKARLQMQVVVRAALVDVDILVRVFDAFVGQWAVHIVIEEARVSVQLLAIQASLRGGRGRH